MLQLAMSLAEPAVLNPARDENYRNDTNHNTCNNCYNYNTNASTAREEEAQASIYSVTNKNRKSDCLRREQQARRTTQEARVVKRCKRVKTRRKLLTSRPVVADFDADLESLEESHAIIPAKKKDEVNL